jgi:very-short-patch-repair endonuclease
MDILTTINGILIRRNFIQNLPYNPNLKMLARQKRKAGILSEVLFWKQVRAKQFYTIDFDRQRIIGNYIVDFYVKALGLVVEIDGISHENKVEYDKSRLAYLESVGLKIFIAADVDVKLNIIDVMETLEKFIINEYGNTTGINTLPIQT